MTETTHTFAEIVNNVPEAMAHYGLSWSVETVSREPGGNSAGKVLAADDAQILVIVDHDAFVTNFPDAKAILLGISATTSLRVMSQAVNRDNPGMPVLERRQRIVNRLAGIRNTGSRAVVTRTVEVKVFIRSAPLPGGTFYEGDNLVEYQAAYMAALLDMGVPSDTARSIALTVELPK